MSSRFINIACGNAYVEGWRNFDFFPHTKAVTQANLLGRLPLSDGYADIVYSSHFLEHIPRSMVAGFLSECYRISKKGSRIRLVLPDFEELCRAYLNERQSGEHAKADFVVLEILDQCVRKFPGGELGAYYDHLKSAPKKNSDLIRYVKYRTGHDLGIIDFQDELSCSSFFDFSKLAQRVARLYCRAVIALLPAAIRVQNVALTSVGECHTWIYDYYTVEKLLRDAGFTSVKRVSADTSGISGFPFIPLDLNQDGSPRKGCESMYIEATRE